MANLPSRYIVASALGGTNVYFNTGVYPTNDTNVECAFFVDESCNSYLFGSRNSNSNTSAGQFNVLSASTSYLGFASTRYSMGSFNTWGELFITNEANEFLMSYRSTYLIELTGATTTFTGTQPMYILAMNNAGSVNYGSNPSCYVHRFAIYQGGSKIKDYYPVYDTQSNEFGLYDFVNDTFLSQSGSGSITSYLYEVQATQGGRAYIEMPFGDVTKMYMTQTPTSSQPTQASRLYSPIKAVADEGYAFLNWTDQHGNIISSSSQDENAITRNFAATEDVVLTANFVKKTDELQVNPYQLKGIAYGTPAKLANEDARKDLFYTFVESFTINEDSLGKTTSTIVCRDIPSAYQTNMPVILYDNLGKKLWVGLIESIDGNVLTCRESLSIFDVDFQFINTSTETYNGAYLRNMTATAGINLLFLRHSLLPTANYTLAQNYPNALTQRKYRAMNGISDSIDVSYEKNGNLFVSLPEIYEISISNAEDYLFEIMSQFGLGIYEQILDTQSWQRITIYVENPLKYRKLVLGDNNDFISNINVTSELQECNNLVIFNEAGTSARGTYGMRNDGSVLKVPGGLGNADNPNFLGWQNCKAKVVMSDDKINTLIAQYLTNSFYNHKITFDIELNNKMVWLDDFKMGRRVDFHIGDKLYHSIVTGRSYSLKENEKEIKRATITLGNVRTSLTSKLNLGKVK